MYSILVFLFAVSFGHVFVMVPKKLRNQDLGMVNKIIKLWKYIFILAWTWTSADQQIEKRKSKKKDTEGGSAWSGKLCFNRHSGKDFWFISTCHDFPIVPIFPIHINSTAIFSFFSHLQKRSKAMSFDAFNSIRLIKATATITHTHIPVQHPYFHLYIILINLRSYPDDYDTFLISCVNWIANGQSFFLLVVLCVVAQRILLFPMEINPE